MIQQLRPALVLVAILTILTGVAYPAAVTAIALAAFPDQAHGSLVRTADGTVIGSRLLAQGFAGAGYFHPRPSAAGKDGYDAAGSSGSNLGPTSRALLDRITKSRDDIRAGGGASPIPVDLVTASASGLDPDISPAAALFQVARVAKARGLADDDVRALVLGHVQDRQFGFLGEPRVNVLALNMALDKTNP